MTTSTSTAKTKTGQVVSNAMQKTIIVKIKRTVMHKKYRKILNRSTKLAVHDAEQVCQVGDMVRIRETRPYSKTKSWVLVEVIPK